MKEVLLFTLGVLLTIAGLILSQVWFPENMIFSIPGGFLIGWYWDNVKEHLI